MPIIRVIDFETTGTEPPSEVCEVGFADIDVQSRKIIKTDGWLCGVRSMPPEVRAIHHISLNECAGRAPFTEASLQSQDVIVFAAHNADFETKFFRANLPMICTYKAALRVWPNAPSHSNGTLRYWLEDQGLISPNHEQTMPPHRAEPDAYVTANILIALLNTGATGREMAEWTKEPKLLPTCPIGKFRGAPWSEIESGFLGWMVRQPTMEEDLKWNARREILRRLNKENEV